MLWVARSPTSVRPRQPLGGCSRARAWPTVGACPPCSPAAISWPVARASPPARRSPRPPCACSRRRAAPRAAAGARSGLTEAGYWAFVDPIAERLDHLWDDGDRCYRIGGEAESAINAALLDDPRGGRAARPSGHRPRGRPRPARWRAACATRRRGASARTRRGRTRCSTSAAGCRACTRPARAWRSRSTPRSPKGWPAPGARATSSGLTASDAQRMADVVQRCAHGAFFRYPNVRLNQINWNAEVFAHAATMTGDTSLLRRDYYLHMRRFVAGVHRPWLADRRGRPCYGGSTNLGPGYRFNYLTTRPPGDAFNLDSAEYANITVHFLLWYARARAVGMPALPRGDRDVLRAWVERVLLGYWTHSGLLNWDTGLGLKRWQIGKTFAFAQQGLLAIARADDFHARPEFGGWAKYFFDRGLALYTRVGRRGGRRHARAAVAQRRPRRDGRGRREQDPVRRADGRQRGARDRPRAGRAQRPGAAAGLRLRPRHRAPGRLDPQLLDRRPGRQPRRRRLRRHRARPPLRRRRAAGRDHRRPPAGGLRGRRPRRGQPHAAGLADEPPEAEPDHSAAAPHARAARHGPRRRPPARAYAAPFQRVEARGAVAAGDVRIATVHRFAPEHVETAWTVTSASRARRSVDVLFPAWTATAQIDAVLHDGTRVGRAGRAAVARPRRVVSPARRAQRLRGRGRRTHADARDGARARDLATALRAPARVRRSRCASSARRASAAAR